MRAFTFAILAAASFFGTAYATPDMNHYEAQYEKPISTPEPSGAVSCAGSSGKNPNSSDEYLIRDDSGWDHINDSSYATFFVCPGDYRSKGTITLSMSGTSQSPRHIVWWSDKDYDAAKTPWQMPVHEQARIKGFVFDGASRIVLDRLTIIPDGYHGVHLTKQSADDNVLNRILVEGDNLGTPTSPKHGVRIHENSGNTVQNSVIRNCRRADDVDFYGILTLGQSDGTRIVNNEVYDCSHAMEHVSSVNTTEDMVIENNDFYVTPAIYTDGKGNYEPSGDHMCAEGGLALKGGSGDSSRPIKVLHNRFWGFRPQDPNPANGGSRDCGGTGVPNGVVFQMCCDAGPTNVVFERNIIYDVGAAILVNTAEPRNNTFRSNLISKVRSYNETNSFAARENSGGKQSWVFNTFHDIASEWFENGQDSELACNLVIDGGSGNSGSASVERNVYIGDSKQLGDRQSKTYPDLADARLEDFTFYRKLQTGPEPVTIDNVRPNAESDFVGHCSSYSELSGYGAD